MELMTNTARIYGKQNQYKKASSIKQKEEGTETDLKQTQVTLYVEPNLEKMSKNV